MEPQTFLDLINKSMQDSVRQLASLPEEFFYNELKRIKEDILKIQSREEVAGALQFTDDD